ncbi:polyketide synthase [Sorangium sp. So ce136]|uniref:polyketide synthase n=1 Tax=Sorangium sp. So ce136 TaxID=3133284 RepID=UPI003F51E04C
MSDSVIDAREIEPGIVQVTMQDRAQKNALSRELVAGLHQAFAAIDENERCKAVVLTGYDNYFCTGGTKDGLLSIQGGEMQFTALHLHSLALDCKVPVIAAMQGHGIGAGFTMGLFADFVVLSRESVYTCNYMSFGFTPGMGATFIVPKKLGISLGEEMLFTAGRYMGAELERRGVPFRVVPRNEVLTVALDVARSLAEKPRLSLIMLKDNLVASLRAELPAAIAQEVKMHEATFHLPEVKDRINALFGK